MSSVGLLMKALIPTLPSLSLPQSLKEGLSVQERMKLFEAKDSKRIWILPAWRPVWPRKERQATQEVVGLFLPDSPVLWFAEKGPKAFDFDLHLLHKPVLLFFFFLDVIYILKWSPIIVSPLACQGAFYLVHPCDKMPKRIAIYTMNNIYIFSVGT